MKSLFRTKACSVTPQSEQFLAVKNPECLHLDNNRQHKCSYVDSHYKALTRNVVVTSRKSLRDFNNQRLADY